MNVLHLETSPYLLQHANNPVHWKGWNAKSLQQAITENKLIIVSVGYSACHWCHVMEHESFEDEEVAKVMNYSFINIKVDREERPDIDAVYMKAVQLMTSRGGWPMNVVCLPNGKPIWGGTYFPKKDWIHYLDQLQNLFENDLNKLEEYAKKLTDGIKMLSIVQTEENDEEKNTFSLENLVKKWQKSFDLEFGGMARAPKFMMPNNYEFLLHYGYLNQKNEILNFVDLTLKKMAFGGLFDVIDGGFSRYSVDLEWHVPHFEKMLYDNGQLVSLYSNAYKLNKNWLYKEVIQKSLKFITQEWLTEENGFYSALDADSLNKHEKLEEGAFYVWQKDELKFIIQEEFELFSQVFNINEFGFWEHNNYVLIQTEELELIAAKNKITLEELQSKKRGWEMKLYQHREKREKPRLDDKLLCSWNAIVLKGYLEAYQAIQDEDYLKIALKNANFIIEKFLKKDGSLWHSYKNRISSITGFLEDYAFTIESFIVLYQTTIDENWLQKAKKLTDYCLEMFYDHDTKFFRFTSKNEEELITVHFEIEDNVIPASNSVMAKNLFLLSNYFYSNDYREISATMLRITLSKVDYPSAFSNWLQLHLLFSENQTELAVCSNNAKEMVNELNSYYRPNILLAGCEQKSDLPILKDRFKENQSLFYECKNQTCGLPKLDFHKIKHDLFVN
ncbi:MAG: hypothetical protein ACI9XR_002355 [Flavobacterium sp.]|jgi:uncharacterized protein YyaL (SSP411 family)